MEESNFISKILNLEYNEDETISTLALSIRCAREITGKFKEHNFETEKKQFSNLTYVSNKLIGLTTYLIIIDLIGNIFSKKNKIQSNDSFMQTLNQFSTLNETQKKSLKNLRNSLAHKFSLGNESEIFVLDYSKNTTDIINVSEENYHSSKRINEKEEKHFTTAYFYNICNLVEDIFQEINDLNKNNKIELLKKYKINGDINFNNLKAMYFIK